MLLIEFMLGNKYNHVVNDWISLGFLVYAIETSGMAEQAQLVVKSNSMQDRITVIHGKVEVCLYPVWLKFVIYVHFIKFWLLLHQVN